MNGNNEQDKYGESDEIDKCCPGALVQVMSTIRYAQHIDHLDHDQNGLKIGLKFLDYTEFKINKLKTNINAKIRQI